MARNKPSVVQALAPMAMAFGAYLMWVRPWAQRWGARDEEVYRRWPGDDLLAWVNSAVTRAVTIDAPPEAVWPWIVQIGQDRGGFYSYTWLENLLGAEIRNADAIVPEYQHREVGEDFWMAPKHSYGGKARMIVARLVENRCLLLVSPEDWVRIESGDRARDGVWGFVLEPEDDGRTRLIMRSLTGPGLSRIAKLANLLFWEPAHFVMERKMMLGIRERVQAQSRPERRMSASGSGLRPINAR